MRFSSYEHGKEGRYGSQCAEGSANRLASGRFAKYKKTLVLLTMVAPAAIWLLLLRYLPMGGIIPAFKNYKINPRIPRSSATC